MHRLIMAAMFIVAIGAILMSGPLGAGHQTLAGKTVSTSLNPTAMTLAVKDLPVAQVNEPF